MINQQSSQDSLNPLQESKSDNWNDYITTPIIFLISGLAGTGKTTSANLIYDLLTEKGGGSFALQSFARTLKDIARENFGWDGIKTTKGRRLLQGIGQTGRAYDEDIWVRQATHKIIDNYPIPVNTVSFDDWRFPNELNYILKNYSGTHLIITIRIDAPSREILKGTSEYNEISETSLHLNNETKYYNYFINNESSMEELKKSLKEIIENVIGE